jgi:hypothetical protein
MSPAKKVQEGRPFPKGNIIPSQKRRLLRDGNSLGELARLFLQDLYAAKGVYEKD